MGVNTFWRHWREVWLFSKQDHSKWLYIKPLQHFSMTFPPPRMTITTSSSSCIWQLSCRGSYHFLEVWLSLMQCPSTSTHWYSFRRPWKDDRLSQPPRVLIQRPTGLELRTLGSQANTPTTKPTTGSLQLLHNSNPSIQPSGPHSVQSVGAA